jgi:hypothetical protein
MPQFHRDDIPVRLSGAATVPDQDIALSERLRVTEALLASRTIVRFLLPGV